MKNYLQHSIVSVSFLLASSLVWAGTLSKTVYDFDDTLMSTPAYIVIYKKGVDPATAEALGHTQKVSTAAFTEVRHALGHEGAYKDWSLHPVNSQISFQNFTGKPGENAFLGHIQESLAIPPAGQWKAAMWDDFAKLLSNSKTAQDVYILTARASTAAHVLEGFQYMQAEGYIQNVLPMENIFAVSDPNLRLKSNPNFVLANEKSEVSKAMVMQDMLDDLEKQAIASQGTIATWAFYDDDYANFAKARDVLIPLAAPRWPHVKITIGYVGALHPGTPHHEVVVLPSSLVTRTNKIASPKAAGF